LMIEFLECHESTADVPRSIQRHFCAIAGVIGSVLG